MRTAAANRKKAGAAPAAKKKPALANAIPEINRSLIYAERELWSPQFALWSRYRVAKPRLPADSDRTAKWIEQPSNSPRAFGGFVGTHLKEFFDALDLWVAHFEESNTLPDVMTISGPAGSGKSAASRIFVQRLVEQLGLKDHQAGKWKMVADAKAFSSEFGILWNRIEKFIEPGLERFIVPKYRLVVLDNFDAIPPSHQQALKNVVSAHAGKVKLLLLCENPKDSMTGFFLSRASVLKTKAISERDALSVVLSICYRNRIGYEREGIQLAFEQHPNHNLSAIIDIIQQVFVQENFVSRENVIKVMHIAVPPPLISAAAAIEPLERCQVCTLRPPCQHISLDELNARGLARRKQLPRYKDGSMACPEFVRCGHCSIFNKYGHCSLDHPKNLHSIEPETKRCPQCTIPWPCEHCAYSSERKRLWHLIEEIRARMGRLRQINIPDPPLYYTRHLEGIPNWRQRVAQIDAMLVTTQTLETLRSVEDWFHNAYSINTLAYTNRCKLLLDTFGDLCTSELIDPNGPSKAPRATPPASSKGARSGVPPSTGAQGGGIAPNTGTRASLGAINISLAPLAEGGSGVEIGGSGKFSAPLGPPAGSPSSLSHKTMSSSSSFPRK